jgi:uncharacterized protein YndB with AHSA1/START domain
MIQDYIAKQSITINASIEKVWEALTKPELIKEYFFGTEVTTDWRVGSAIIYRGEWQGKSYEDKGTILEVSPNERLVSTYWSSMSNKPDQPENYKTVAYDLKTKDGQTEVMITQDNNSTEEEKNHSEKNWAAVLDGLKKLLEK